MAKSRSRKRSRATQYAGWAIAILLAAVAYARHAHTTEFVLAGLVAGLIAGGVLGSRRRPVVVQPAPRRKAAPATTPRKPVAQKPKRVVHRDVDADVLLAEMDEWSDDCVDGRCGECSGYNPEGGKCTHCNHPGRRRGPGKDTDLSNDEIPY